MTLLRLINTTRVSQLLLVRCHKKIALSSFFRYSNLTQNIPTYRYLYKKSHITLFFSSPKVPTNSCFEEIEDDVLSQLFSESVEQEIERSDHPMMSFPTNSIEPNTQELILEQLPDVSGLQLSFYADSGIGLMDEACSLPPSEISFNNIPHFLLDDFYIPPLEDIVYCEGQDIDDYYNYFLENVLDELKKYPFLFGDVVDSLMECLDEETSTETRRELVKLLCQRLKCYSRQSRQ